MRMAPIYDDLENKIIMSGKIVDWPDLRDMVDLATQGELGPKTLDRYTQALVNRLHKSAPELLAR